MDEKSIIEQLLNLGGDWFVERLELESETSTVHIYIEHARDNVLDILSGTRFPIYDLRPERVWQHLSILQDNSFIHCRIPRFRNAKGKVESVRVPWADEGVRHTHLFENKVIETLLATHNQTKTAHLLRTSFDVVNNILHSSVSRGMDKRALDQDTIHQLSIDEKSFGAGQNYISVLVDPVGKRVLDVIEGRDTEAATALINNTLSEKQLKEVEKVSMDMWEPYMITIKELIPQADIVHDMFHIVKYLNEGVDNTRKSESKNNPILTDSKYAMLKNAENRTDLQKEKFFDIMDTNLKTADAWAFTETFKQIFDIKFEDISKAWAYFDIWIDQVNRSLIKPMIKVANTMQNHAVGIINNIKHKISNAISERFNGKIQTLNVIGRGYRKFDNYRSAILFFNGKLDLLSHNSQ